MFLLLQNWGFALRFSWILWKRNFPARRRCLQFKYVYFYSKHTFAVKLWDVDWNWKCRGALLANKLCRLFINHKSKSMQKFGFQNVWRFEKLHTLFHHHKWFAIFHRMSFVFFLLFFSANFFARIFLGQNCIDCFGWTSSSELHHSWLNFPFYIRQEKKLEYNL